MNFVKIYHILNRLILVDADIHTLGKGIIEHGRIEVLLDATTKAIHIMDVQIIHCRFIKEVIVGGKDTDTR